MPSIGNVEKFLNSERSKQSKLSIFLKKSDCNQKKKKPVINSNQSSKYHEVG
jgi:desulfoferrodoxin (superoxide reductase-like protein)